MQKPLIAGIYRIYDPEHGVSFIGYSFNVNGILKRFRFELGLNSCTHKPLQAMYNAAGGRVREDVLEEMSDCDANDSGAEARLTAAMQKWQNKLEGGGEKVYVILL